MHSAVKQKKFIFSQSEKQNKSADLSTDYTNTGDWGVIAWTVNTEYVRKENHTNIHAITSLCACDCMCVCQRERERESEHRIELMISHIKYTITSMIIAVLTNVTKTSSSMFVCVLFFSLLSFFHPFHSELPTTFDQQYHTIPGVSVCIKAMYNVSRFKPNRIFIDEHFWLNSGTVQDTTNNTYAQFVNRF